MIKRLFDIAAAAAGLVLLAPLFALVALWIKVDSTGPVFFRQLRVGRFGKPFNIIKFRTMSTRTGAGLELTIGADCRITRAGSLLRRYKIDELPQLINVLQGTMSLVGPRPEVPRYVACYPPDARAIVLSVAPGITDWASILYREESQILGQAPDAERAYIDTILPIKIGYYVRYVQERSFWTDLRIIFGTLVAIIH
jgi:lipopolysaccharide/colanic/teichoic acid biosynthesis glycosyltransferase